MRGAVPQSEDINAIMNSDVERVRSLLDGSVGHDRVLEIAVHNGLTKIARLALEHGADPRSDGDWMLLWAVQQAVQQAVQREFWEMASLLLDKGADAVAMVGQARTMDRAAVIGWLNEMVASIPRDQRQKLLRLSKGDFPALVAAEAAAQRLASRRLWSPPSA